MKPATVAYPGRPGAYSELAARRFLDNDARIVPSRTFGQTVHAVTNGFADYGVLPTHNVLAGVVRESSRLMAAAPVVALDELKLPISHALLAVPGATFADIKTIYSHPVALKQCRRFFADNPSIMPVDDDDTGGAVEQVVERDDPTEAAIAGAHTAVIHGARILARGIEDGPGNQTLFILFASAKKTRYASAYSSRPAEGQALGSRGNRRN